MAYYESDFANMNVASGTIVSYTLTDLASTNRDSVLLQAQLFTTDLEAVLFRFDADPAIGACDGALDHLSTAWLVIRGYTTLRFLLVTKTTGANVAGGANDRMMIRGAMGQQVA